MAWTDAEPPHKPDLYVVARILDCLRAAEGGVPRTRLQGAVRLNYDLYRGYLSLLLRKGWVEMRGADEEQERVHLTDKGRHRHDALVGWIRDAFGDIRL